MSFTITTVTPTTPPRYSKSANFRFPTVASIPDWAKEGFLSPSRTRLQIKLEPGDTIVIGDLTMAWDSPSKLENAESDMVEDDSRYVFLISSTDVREADYVFSMANCPASASFDDSFSYTPIKSSSLTTPKKSSSPVKGSNIFSTPIKSPATLLKLRRAKTAQFLPSPPHRASWLALEDLFDDDDDKDGMESVFKSPKSTSPKKHSTPKKSATPIKNMTIFRSPSTMRKSTQLQTADVSTFSAPPPSLSPAVSWVDMQDFVDDDDDDDASVYSQDEFLDSFTVVYPTVSQFVQHETLPRLTPVSEEDEEDEEKPNSSTPAKPRPLSFASIRRYNAMAVSPMKPMKATTAIRGWIAQRKARWTKTADA